jgi:multidrug efflux pump subunit AcrA (membrane-fusion protein)
MTFRAFTQTSPSPRTAGLLLIYCVLALAPLAATGCGRQAEANSLGEQTKAAEVATVYPKRMDLTREIDQPGYLQPYDETPIFTKIAGFAKDWKVDKGSWVKKGDLMLELYVPEVVQDLRVKAAKVEQAKADLKQAKEAAKAAKAAEDAARADIEAKAATINSAEAQVMRWQAEEVRSRKLLEKGVFDQQTADEVINQLRASQAVRDEARAKWASAKATFEQMVAQHNKAEADVEVAVASVSVAEAAHDQWRDWLGYARITAPYDGVVTARKVSPGDFLQPSNSGSTSHSSAPLFVMMRTDIMRCTIEVPELDAVLVKPGDKAVVRLQAMPGVETVGEVTLTSESLDMHARTLSVEVHLKNPDNALKAGMYANVKLLAKLRGAMTLPAAAILSDILADGDRDYCYMVDDGKVRKTFLQVGARCDEGVQVLRKQLPGGKWEEFTGKEVVVTDPKQQKEGAAPSGLVGPKALRDGQEVALKGSETH